ncbi:MAG: hypothetical protein AB1634_04845 [Thermodesulfobacteriota bacterium]
MERCPACRARRQGALCPRCGADLTPLLRLEEEARRLEAAGIQRLAAGDRRAARELLARSLRCQRRPLAMALAAYLQPAPC